MKRQKLTKIHQIVLGCALGLAFILGVEAILAMDDGVSVRLFDIHNGRWSMTLRDGDDKVKAKSRGQVEVLEGESGARVKVSGRGQFTIDAKENGIRRQLEVRASTSGESTYAYRVDGRSQTFDESAQQWLSGILLDCYRHGGFDAKARAGRLFESGGVAALEAELELIKGDDIRRRYLQAILVRDELGSADVAALLENAQRRIRGDHSLMSVLRSMSPTRLQDPAIADAYFNAARSLSGDHSKTQVLAHILEPSLSAEAWQTFFETAATINSDHEASRLAIDFAGVRQGPLPRSFIGFLKTINSDNSQRRAIESVLESELEATDRDALLATAASGISSDHEAAQLLISHASLGQSAISPGALDLLESIASDNSQMRAADALIEHAAIDQLPSVLEVTHIESDHLLANLLVSTADRIGPVDQASAELRAAVKRAGSTLNGEVYQQRVKEAWGIDQN